MIDGKTLTIAYVTARRDPKIEWFFDSLARQISEHDKISLIVVDAYEPVMRVGEGWKQIWDHCSWPNFTRVAPKPNVWSGQYRLTKEDWWSASSDCNTALCLCQTTHIAFLDDLSVLTSTWLQAVKDAVSGDYIGCGAYQKVKNLNVKNGEVISYDDFPAGHDRRLSIAKGDCAPCTPGWLYGCSFVAPLEALLTVGGFPEFTDGLGAQDYILGFALKNAGFHLKYCKKMMTLESEELHFAEPPRKRMDKGVSPNKSHAALNIAKSTKYFENYYEGGIRRMREEVLSGKPFPIVQIPTCDWYDSQPLSEMV
jgi:hypothetical protein